MAIIFVFILISFSIYIPSTIEKSAINTAIESAKNTVSQYKIIRSYYTKNVIKKVLEGSALKAEANHKNNHKKVPLPATFILDISEEFSKEGVTLKLYSKFPFSNRQDRQLDDFGQAAWAELTQNPEQNFTRTDDINGVKTVRVAIADKMVNSSCVGCHNSHADSPKTDWKMGDVRGVLEVQVAIEDQITAGNFLSIKIISILVISILAILAIAAYNFKNTVSMRLQKVSSALNDMTNRNLNTRLDDTSNDEISYISKAFNQSASQLQESFNSINEQISLQTGVTEDLNALAKNSQSGVKLQQQETEQVASSITDIASTAAEMATLATNTVQQMQKTKLEVDSGQNTIANNKQAVERLSHEMETASTVVSALETESENIGSVLDVIRSIAEQTNLLALNAAIEAARAGEQGRGFAVVADEVRTLASRTQSSTDEIQKMIEQLQDGAKKAVSTISQGNECLHENIEHAAKTNEVIANIAFAINDIGSLNSKISAAAEKQSLATEELNTNIGIIAKVATENITHSDQLFSSASNITKMTESIDQQLKKFN